MPKARVNISNRSCLSWPLRRQLLALFAGLDRHLEIPHLTSMEPSDARVGSAAAVPKLELDRLAQATIHPSGVESLPAGEGLVKPMSTNRLTGINASRRNLPDAWTPLDHWT